MVESTDMGALDSYLSRIDTLASQRGLGAASAVHRARTVGFNETVLKMNKDERNMVLELKERLRISQDLLARKHDMY